MNDIGGHWKLAESHCQFKNGVIDLQYVVTEDQLAEILPLETAHFQNMRHQMGIIDVRESSV